VVTGVIEHFDDRRGDGWLRASDGELLYFHCVEIADGSRTIAIGAIVSAQRRVGHVGHDEAIDVRPLSDDRAR